MRFSSAVLAGLVGTAFAAPTTPVTSALEPRGANGYCVSAADAQKAADIFQELIQSYSDELARSALTLDFVDYTSSVSIIIDFLGAGNIDLVGPTFVGRKAFIAAQGSQPEIPFEQLNVFHGCTSVSLRWTTSDSAAGQPTKANDIPVVGNVIMELVESAPGDDYNFRIKTIYSEFNTAAWLVNLGVFPLPATSTISKRDMDAILYSPLI